MKTFLKTAILTFVAILAMSSCKTPANIAYFQDATNKDTIFQAAMVQTLKVSPGDKLMIVVSSKDPQLAALFNLPIAGYRIGMNQSTNSSQSTMSYTVDPEGNIDFPVLGRMKVSGMQRSDIAEMIKKRLVDENQCKDAVVTVEMDNLYINVLGEVNRAGRYAMTKDQLTVFDALGMAGDLSIQGQRENVMVIRIENGETHTYSMDLTKLADVTKSPGFYLQQNDVVYVEPNPYRKRQTTVNGNNALSTSFWISVASLLMTVSNVVINATK